MTNIETLHKAAMVFLDNLENSKKYLDYISFSTYIRDFRTITLGLPRQSGKTKYMLDLKGKTSSVMFVPNENMLQHCYTLQNTIDRSNIFTFENMFSLIRFNRGISRRGLKYSLFLIDEYYVKKEHENNFMELLTELKAQDMFTEDFYVLKIGTPRF